MFDPANVFTNAHITDSMMMYSDSYNDNVFN